MPEDLEKQTPPGLDDWSWPAAGRGLFPPTSAGSVLAQLEQLQALEVRRNDLERERTELDAEIRERYRQVWMTLRRRAVELGEMPEPSGAFRSRGEPTKTQLILEALPGTRDEIAERTGIKPTVVATILGRLQRDDGPVRKVDTKRVPGAPKRTVTVYDLAVDRATGHAGALAAARKRGEGS